MANKTSPDSNWYAEWEIGSKTGMGRGPGGAIGNRRFYYPKPEWNLRSPDAIDP